MNNKLQDLLLKPQTIIALLLLVTVGAIAYSQYGKGDSVTTSAALVNNLSWVFTEPEITVSTKIYRTTTGFLEDPDEQYLIATVPYPTSTYADTAVSSGVTYYYSIFQIDDTSAVFDPVYDSLVPVTTTTEGGGSSGGGSSGGGSSGGGSSGGGSSTPPSAPPASGSSTRLVNSNGTYYLIQNGSRKGITSPGILNSCGFDFSDATIATSTDLALPTVPLLLPCGGALVKSTADQTVYLVSNGKRYGFISAAVFQALGYKFSSVLIVTDPELQALPRDTNLSDSTKAHLPETDININGTIYWIDGASVKRPYPSLEVYNSWHINNDFSKVVPANSADLVLTTGPMVTAR